MDMQAYLRAALAGKTVILVGNAPFTRDRATFIDSHDVVFRFNQFRRDWFGLNGQRIDYWFNNLGRKGVAWRAENCTFAKQLNPAVIVGTPHEDDKLKRLKDAIAYYPHYGLDLIYPDSGIPTRHVTAKQPSTGFYTAIRLLTVGIPVAVTGFNGGVSDHHDGGAEMAYLRSRPEVSLHMDFS